MADRVKNRNQKSEQKSKSGEAGEAFASPLRKQNVGNIVRKMIFLPESAKCTLYFWS
jgi:hypothetical protein